MIRFAKTTAARARRALAAAALLALAVGPARGQNAPAPQMGQKYNPGTGTMLDVSEINLSAIKDAKARAAMEQIKAKMAEIKEFAIGDIRLEMTSPTGQKMATEIQAAARRPNLSSVHMKSIGAIPALSGQEQWMISDGKLLWTVIQHAPGSERVLEERLKLQNAPQDVITRMTADWKKLQVTRLNRTRLQSAGIEAAGMDPNGPFKLLFSLMDMASLQLTADSAEAWTFEAGVNKASQLAGSAEKMTVTFDKKDGVPRKLLALPLFSVTLAKVRVNPAKPIPAETFTYEPPADAIVKDLTQSRIQDYQQGQRRQ
jgi:outer membrane lipoprotein-sorting protein